MRDYEWQTNNETSLRAEYVRGAVGKVGWEAEEANEGDAVEQVERGEVGDGDQYIEEIVDGVGSRREEAEGERELLDIG